MHTGFVGLECGTVTQEWAEDLSAKTPRLCPHTNTDARGSSSSTHRVYCKDRGQRVYECPQLEMRLKGRDRRVSPWPLSVTTIVLVGAPRRGIRLSPGGKGFWRLPGSHPGSGGNWMGSNRSVRRTERHQRSHREIDDEEDHRVTQSAFPATAVCASSAQWQPGALEAVRRA